MSENAANLDLLLKASQEEYDQAAFKRHAIQHAILRNYLWLSTVLFGVQIYLFTHIPGPDFPTPWPLYANAMFYVFFFSALCLSGAAFVIGIYAMKGGFARIPYSGDYDNLFVLADKEARQTTQPCRMRIEMINSLINAIRDQRNNALKKGKFIRSLPPLMLASLFFCVLAFIGASLYLPDG